MKTNALSAFIKILLLLILGWAAMVLIPFLQFGSQNLHEDRETGENLPHALSGLAIRGSKVYEQNGCATCHTQQARNNRQDSTQGYGKRAAVARDFTYQPATFAGINRLGPDLTNIGTRKKSTDWHHQHLYNPTSVSPGSIMPSYAFLYEKRKINGQPSAEALTLPSTIKVQEDYEIIPTEEAKALVAYLLSLDQSYSLPESPIKEE